MLTSFNQKYNNVREMFWTSCHPLKHISTMRITMLKLECKYMVHSGKKGEQNTAWPTIYRHQKIQGLHTSGFCSLMPQNSTVRPNFTALLSSYKWAGLRGLKLHSDFKKSHKLSIVSFLVFSFYSPSGYSYGKNWFTIRYTWWFTWFCHNFT